MSMGDNRKDGTYIVWRVWLLKEENGTYGTSGLVGYILEMLCRLCVWIDVLKKEFVLVPTFWNDFGFFYFVGCFVDPYTQPT